jgi:hypothetical protein
VGPALAGLALAGSALLFGGCKVDVSLGFECTGEDGQTHQAGDSFQQGCNTCTCNGDGTIGCTEMACAGCDYNGQFHEVGSVFDAGDNCNTCECQASGEVSCTLLACPGCEGEPPLCAQDGGDPGGETGCWYEPVCDESGNWTCVSSCDCEGAPIPDCPAPPDPCFYNGPICIDGAWSCGDLICEGTCDPEPAPECLQPPDGGCWAEAVCTEMGWQCVIFCQPVCEDPEPACGPDAFPECTDQGWTCVPFNMTCPDVGMVDCPPPVDPFCSMYAVCHGDGEWYCQEDCPPELCMGPDPECPLGPPNCSYYAVCTSFDDWQCAESCF